MTLEGRVAVVVGAGTPTGAACARRLGAAGAAVLCADVEHPAATVSTIRGDGAIAESVAVDTDDLGSTEAMAAAAQELFGRLDILVTCDPASEALRPSDWISVPAEAWDECFARYVRGTWLSCRAVAPYLKRQRSGRIVTFGSTAAVAGVAGYLPYVTAKAALVGLTRALARELGEFGVAVNMVCPSIGALDGSDPVNAEAALGTGATPDQVADAVVFLAGDGTDFVTGQSWVVDGGLVLQ